MTETLLDKAEVNYNVAVMIYNSMNDDEIYLNNIGYNLQQAVELAIKFVLEREGVAYPRIHAIEQLISLADSNNIDLYLDDYIREHSEMFSTWEARTRHILGYRIELSKIQHAIPAVKTTLENIRQYYE